MFLAIVYHLFNYLYFVWAWACAHFLFIFKKAKRPPKQPFQREKGIRCYFSVAVPSALYTKQPRDEFLSVVE